MRWPVYPKLHNSEHLWLGGETVNNCFKYFKPLEDIWRVSFWFFLSHDRIAGRRRFIDQSYYNARHISCSLDEDLIKHAKILDWINRVCGAFFLGMGFAFLNRNRGVSAMAVTPKLCLSEVYSNTLWCPALPGWDVRSWWSKRSRVVLLEHVRSVFQCAPCFFTKWIGTIKIDRYIYKWYMIYIYMAQVAFVHRETHFLVSLAQLLPRLERLEVTSAWPNW